MCRQISFNKIDTIEKWVSSNFSLYGHFVFKGKSMTRTSKSFLGTLLISLGVVGQSVSAALPPKYQNIKDLEVLVEFIKAHDMISSALKSIDLVNHTIIYRDGCVAKFDREKDKNPEGWVGPASGLKFKASNCPIK